jgi:hypothetical protein
MRHALSSGRVRRVSGEPRAYRCPRKQALAAFLREVSIPLSSDEKQTLAFYPEPRTRKDEGDELALLIETRSSKIPAAREATEIRLSSASAMPSS